MDIMFMATAVFIQIVLEVDSGNAAKTNRVLYLHVHILTQ